MATTKRPAQDSGEQDPWKTRLSMLGKIKDPRNRAWYEFYDRYKGFVAHVIDSTYGGQFSVAEVGSLIDDVFVSLVKAIHNYEKGRFRSFLSTITKRRCADAIRSRKRERGLPLSEPTYKSGTDTRSTRKGSLRPRTGDNTRTRSMKRIKDSRRNPAEYVEAQDWAALVLSKTLAVVKKKVSDARYQIFDFVVVRGHSPQEAVEQFGKKRNAIDLAVSRVRSVFKTTAKAIEIELNSPVLPAVQ